jgi:RNA ligase
MTVEFRAWPKIARGVPFRVTISEKINGTNACIIIKEGKLVGCQSRTRLITPDEDNYGFAAWTETNKEDLLSLGEGYHFGEWAGPGIQKNPHLLKEKTLFLFNTLRWNPNNPNRPKCCSTVPVLFEGDLLPNTIQEILENLKENADGTTPEGVVVYYHTLKTYSKHTIDTPKGKWNNGKENNSSSSTEQGGLS